MLHCDYTARCPSVYISWHGWPAEADTSTILRCSRHAFHRQAHVANAEVRIAFEFDGEVNCFPFMQGYLPGEAGKGERFHDLGLFVFAAPVFAPEGGIVEGGASVAVELLKAHQRTGGTQVEVAFALPDEFAFQICLGLLQVHLDYRLTVPHAKHCLIDDTAKGHQLRHGQRRAEL